MDAPPSPPVGHTQKVKQQIAKDELVKDKREQPWKNLLEEIEKENNERPGR